MKENVAEVDEARRMVLFLFLSADPGPKENAANTNTLAVYAVVVANALVALAIIGVFYLVFAK